MARSRREGRPVPHRHGTLDLASDGVAYAVAHGLRLDPGTSYNNLVNKGASTVDGWTRARVSSSTALRSSSLTLTVTAL